MPEPKESPFDYLDIEPGDDEPARVTCLHCKKRRKPARLYVAPFGVGPVFYVCSEHRELEPVEGRDWSYSCA